MAEDSMQEIHNQYYNEQHKYTYFMLAAAVSAIGFAIQKTSGMKITYSMLPAGFAVISWGLSFFCGAQNRSWVQATLRANLSLLELYRGIHENQPPLEWQRNAAISGVSEAAKSNATSAGKYAIWQFRFFAIGGIFFLAWHVLDMLHR